ncbi:TAT-variant-translocated molybdopterin oxidoreductase [Myxococcaceae bacterium GXIMD 01537]
MKPTHDGAPSQDTTASFALPVVSDRAASTEAHAHEHEDIIGTALEQAAAEGVASEGGFGRTYWRSLEEKLGAPEYLESTRPEFPAGADLPPSGLVRREFMQLMGASLALAGVTGCTTRPPDERMVAYTKTPAEMVPGNALHYASGMTMAGQTAGLLITAREGRPVKVEGNPQHPINQGAAGVFEQAFLLSLYDPSRARILRQGKTPRALRTLADDVSSLVSKASAADGGARIRFLTEPLNSPLLAGLRNSIQKKLPNARFHSYLPVASQDAETEGVRAVFGKALSPVYDFSKADVVVSLDADFLESRPSNLGYSRQFANRRDPNQGNLNRLYVAEARYSITGGMADHRLRAKSQEILGVAAAIASAVGSPAAGAVAAAAKTSANPAHQKWVEAVAADLRAAAGKSLVVAGERQPAAVHALVHALNAALGNVGTTVQYVEPIAPEANGGLTELVQELREGRVDALIITAWNPLYTAPVDSGLADVLDPAKNGNRAKFSVLYTSLFEDETSAHVDWFVPAAHQLETWSDGRALDGTVSLAQPLIQPLYNGVPTSELLALFLDEPFRPAHQLLRDHWKGQAAAGDYETQWETWVSAGIVPGTAHATVSVNPNMEGAAAAIGAYVPPATSDLEVDFVADYTLFDGRFGNSTWLQELPDPISKIVWDNAAYISPATAERLQLKQGDLAKLTYNGRELQVPVWMVPGTEDDVVVLPLGYGRSGLHETVAAGVGFNANLLRTTKAPWFDGGAKLEKVRGSHKFSLTQHHWRMEGRPLALDMSLEELKSDPVVLKRVRGELPSVLPDFKYEDYKWAMAIDLTRCTGCSACTVACQAENNIPIVGKQQVGVGREMHWLRIDRYFSSSDPHKDDPNPQMVMQPIMCVHCEKAPCEYVCPVNATVHSDEGLNDMVYNRCVGTRYCANNCPYKVRRFNYLHYTQGKSPTEKMLMNPDVTVRARGVMEKCTYCVQRIERVRITARVENRAIQEKELLTACQQTCPTQAITFGTLSDPNARVSKLHEDDRAYKLLHELGTKPRTAHLVRVRNPNSALVPEKPAGSPEGGHH